MLGGKRFAVHRRLTALGYQLVEKIDDATRMLELLTLTGLLVDEQDLETSMKIGLRLEALGDALGVECSTLAEDVGVGPKVNRGAALAGLPTLLELSARLAALVRRVSRIISARSRTIFPRSPKKSRPLKRW